MVRAEVCVSSERSSGLTLITTPPFRDNEISTDSEEILVEIDATVLTKVIKQHFIPLCTRERRFRKPFLLNELSLRNNREHKGR